jgi:hypothetical protein
MGRGKHPGSNNGRHRRGRCDQKVDGEHRPNPAGSKARRSLRRRRGLSTLSWAARRAAEKAARKKEQEAQRQGEEET